MSSTERFRTPLSTQFGYHANKSQICKYFRKISHTSYFVSQVHFASSITHPCPILKPHWNNTVDHLKEFCKVFIRSSTNKLLAMTFSTKFISWLPLESWRWVDIYIYISDPLFNHPTTPHLYVEACDQGRSNYIRIITGSQGAFEYLKVDKHQQHIIQDLKNY